MANKGTGLPNLKICIDNTDQLSDSDGEESEHEEGIELAVMSDNESEISEEPLEVEVPAKEHKREERPFQETRRYTSKAGDFVTGIDINSEEVKEQKAQRAKRFGLEASRRLDEEVDLKGLYQSLGIRDIETGERGIRPEAIHLRGVDDMSTKDVFQYFQEFAPGSIEWIDDSSCNVVWLDHVTAARAMLKLSVNPIAQQQPAPTPRPADTQHAEMDTDEPVKESCAEAFEAKESSTPPEKGLSHSPKSGSTRDTTKKDRPRKKKKERSPKRKRKADSGSESHSGSDSDSSSSSSSSSGSGSGSNSGSSSSSSSSSSSDSESVNSSYDELNLMSDEDAETGEKHKSETKKDEEKKVRGKKKLRRKKKPRSQPKDRSENKEEEMEEEAAGTKEDGTPSDSTGKPPAQTATPSDDSAERVQQREEAPPGASKSQLPPGKWRLGLPAPKSKQLFLRFANKADKKVPGAEKRSKYYQKYGNPNFGGTKGLLSSSRKRKFRDDQRRRAAEQEANDIDISIFETSDPVPEEFSVVDLHSKPVERETQHSQTKPLVWETSYLHSKPVQLETRHFHTKSLRQEIQESDSSPVVDTYTHATSRLKGSESSGEGDDEVDVELELEELLAPPPKKRSMMMYADEEEERILAKRKAEPESTSALDARSRIERRKRDRMIGHHESQRSSVNDLRAKLNKGRHRDGGSSLPSLTIEVSPD